VSKYKTFKVEITYRITQLPGEIFTLKDERQIWKDACKYNLDGGAFTHKKLKVTEVQSG